MLRPFAYLGRMLFAERDHIKESNQKQKPQFEINQKKLEIPWKANPASPLQCRPHLSDSSLSSWFKTLRVEKWLHILLLHSLLFSSQQTTIYFSSTSTLSLPLSCCLKLMVGLLWYTKVLCFCFVLFLFSKAKIRLWVFQA